MRYQRTFTGALPLLAACVCLVAFAPAHGRAEPPGAREGGARKAAAERDSRFDARHARVAAAVGEGLAGCGARENLRVLCDEIGGRLAATDGARRAREFAEERLRRYGLSNVHQETFGMEAWRRGPFRCEVTAPKRFEMKAVALGNTPSTPPEGIEAEVVDAAHGNPLELDRAGDGLKGKWALVEDGVMPGGRWIHRSEIMREIVKRGAAGLLFQSSEPGSLPMTGMCWLGGASPVPAAGISREDGEWMRRTLASGARVTVRLAMENEMTHAEEANVVGEIPGLGDEYVIVGAHLDAWDIGTGAVDNGTGVVAVLEAARTLAAIGVRPAAGIRFVLFMAEESGLEGARAYALRHEGELPRCRAMINCDMTGAPAGIRVMGHQEARPFFEELLRSLDSFDLSAGVSHRPGIYGDHQPFLIRGVPVVAPASILENDCERWYHTSADTYDKVAPRQLALEGAFLAAVALELAWPAERPIAPLDESGVRALVDEFKLGPALEIWGDWRRKN